MYDIGIIGAGPAGATLARLLADRYRVLLLDGGRRKCCGGILAPEAQDALIRFGWTPPESVLVEPQPAAVAVIDIPNRLTRNYVRQYVNIDRAEFDRWLLSLVPTDKVDVRERTLCLGLNFDNSGKDGFSIEILKNGVMKEERVRCLVGADGACSRTRQRFFKDVPLPRKYIAVQKWYESAEFDFDPNGIDFSRFYSGIFDPELTDFYCWTIPKNDRLIVGGAFKPGKNVRHDAKGLVEKLESHGLRLGKPFRHEAAQMLRPVSTSTICLGADRVFLVGEAAGLISPSSAEGISPALLSAEALADAMLDAGSVEKFSVLKYRRNLRGLLWSLRFKQLKIPAMFSPWLRNWVIRSGLTAGTRTTVAGMTWSENDLD